eukprot:71166_1
MVSTSYVILFTSQSNKHMSILPQLTAGGSRDALIATPTRLEVWSSSTETATPKPEKKAIGNPARNVVLVPRLSISFVGHSLAISVQKVHKPGEGVLCVPNVCEFIQIHLLLNSKSKIIDISTTYLSTLQRGHKLLLTQSHSS